MTGAVRGLRRETGINVPENKLRFLGLSREKQRLVCPDYFFDLCLGEAKVAEDGAFVVKFGFEPD